MFMATGILVATFRSHFSFLMGNTATFPGSDVSVFLKVLVLIIYGIMATFLIFNFISGGTFMGAQDKGLRKDILISFITGLIFGLGLMVSGMCRITKVLGFLTINSNWDPSLLFVMAVAVAINLITFNMIMKGSPIFANDFSIPENKEVDARLLVGAAIFGVGWGLGGLCPGPAILNSFVLTNATIWLISMGLGSVVTDELRKRKVLEGAFSK